MRLFPERTPVFITESGCEAMRGVLGAVDSIRRSVFAGTARLALGMDLLNSRGPGIPLSVRIREAAMDQKHFNEPLVNIIPHACDACPPKQIRITDSCQGGIPHPCMAVCPKDAICLDGDKRCRIDQSKCVKCGKCFDQRPCWAISKIERPCAAQKRRPTGGRSAPMWISF